MATDRFLTYTLSGLLPDVSHLTLDMAQGILILSAEQGTILEVQRFPPEEMYVLIVLFSSYPNYATDASLLAAKESRDVLECQESINDATAHGQRDIIMRTVRNDMSRARIKLRLFGIDVKSIIESGYLLLAVQRKLATHS